VVIRPAAPADYAAISQITTAAFGGPEGGEAGIIEGVRREGAVLAEFVAEDDGAVVGHVLFSRMRADPPRLVAGLGPLAVTPGRQNSGLGQALSMAGVAACRELGAEAIVVLGHPNYYPRFGFSAEAAAQIASPYAGRPSFMAMALRPGALDQPIKVDYPAAFN
jgi:putative acetyltransferase